MGDDEDRLARASAARERAAATLDRLNEADEARAEAAERADNVMRPERREWRRPMPEPTPGPASCAPTDAERERSLRAWAEERDRHLRAWVEERIAGSVNAVAVELARDFGDLVLDQLEGSVADLAGLQREVRDLRQAADDLRTIIKADLRSSSPIDLPALPLRSSRSN